MMGALFDALRGTSSIQAAVTLGIPLKRQHGGVAWALCPMHGETGHASLFLSDERGWYCYGCHRGGDAIRLYQEYLGLEPLDAARALARDMGIDAEDDAPGTLYVNARHLRDGLKARRTKLLRDAAEASLEADEAINRLIHNEGAEACWENPRFHALLEKRGRLEARMDELQTADDAALLEIIKEAENGDQEKV